MPQYTLTCPECGLSFDPTVVQTYCPDCKSPILTHYDLNSISNHVKKEEFRSRPRGMWRWHELLPVLNPQNQLTLGEGDTPLLEIDKIGASLALTHLFVKDESLNPTGTFKARGMAAAISKAVELGVREFAIPTAGNAGGALAFYAGRAGLKAHIYMPKDTPRANKAEVQISGADLRLVDGLINDAAKACAADCELNGWFDVSTFKEPFRVEGKKIMGYELAEVFDWRLPDVILYPTGGGTGLVGMWKAFDEMEQLGWIGSERPRMVSVQAAGCAPVVKAFAAGAKRAEFWQNAATLASGLRVPGVFADRLILRCLYDSGGTAVSVTDEEILTAQAELARSEGIFAAPEGAATLAGLKALARNGWCKPDENIVLFNTGTGLKYV